MDAIARARRRLRGLLRRGRLRFARGAVLARSPRFAQLVTPGARLERVASGFRFAEGPVWLAERGCLLASDIPADRIVSISADGRVRVFREPSGRANGLTRDRDGRLIACEHANRRVTRSEPDGALTVLADSFAGRRLNSPNDVVVRSDGAIFFTDPAAGIPAQLEEQPVRGVYRVWPATGELARIADDFLVPNGLAFSPDESTLYVDDSSPERHHVRAFDVSADGALSNGRVFASMPAGAPGPPDGMKIDARGHVFCTGPGGVWVFDPAGEHLGIIAPPEPPANCAFGGYDWRSLYITARSSVYRIRLNEPGTPVPSPAAR